MNVSNLEVLKGLVAKKNHDTPQLIRVSASTADFHSRVVDLKWYNVQSDGTVEEPFASANLYYGDAAEWLSSWAPLTHLIQGRIESLERMAEQGTANRFSHNMAYQLFANNLVDYADKYRGMRSVVLHEFEAFADVVLSTEKSGAWTVPPFFIDSVAHLAGFIMNVSDAVDTKANFCVTPGWNSMRFARPLVAGEKYRSYTKMIPTAEDPSVYLGDVYILQDDTIIGMVGGIKFRRYPRILLNRFFSPPDEEAAKAHSTGPSPSLKSPPARVEAPQKPDPAVPAASPAVVTSPGSSTTITGNQTAPLAVIALPKPQTTETSAVAQTNPDSTAAKAIALIANEAGLEVADLVDEASFASLGIDSLMSLVIAEKFREQLGITVGGSLFLEYPCMGDLRSWLEQYYN